MGGAKQVGGVNVATPSERQELVRRMILQGFAPHEIRRRFAAGFVHPPNGKDLPFTPPDRQRFYRLQAPRVSALLQELGEGWRNALDRADVLETYAGAALERLAGLAVKAEDARNYHAAIRANTAIIAVVGLRTSRWRRDEVAPSSSSGDDLSGLTVEELEEEVAIRRDRVVRLELLPGGRDVVEGGGEVVRKVTG